jgi:hypothetical protein
VALVEWLQTKKAIPKQRASPCAGAMICLRTIGGLPVSTTMDNVATALTDSLRLGSISEYGLNVNNTVNGTVWQSAVCTEFNWYWLLFPAVLIALTIISLGLMVASTASGPDQTPVWKSSILPFFYLGNTSAQSELYTLSLKEMQKAAKTDQVETKARRSALLAAYASAERREN